MLSVPNPAGGTLPTQGFWGAVFTSGGVRENGDRYAPLYIGANNPPDGTNGGPNPNYDPDGYDYTVEVGVNGEVRLFDPIFCATGPSLSGGWYGAGDHWTTDGTGGGNTLGPQVSVQFRLYDTNGTRATSTTDDTPTGSVLAYDPWQFHARGLLLAGSGHPRTMAPRMPPTARATPPTTGGSRRPAGAGCRRARTA